MRHPISPFCHAGTEGTTRACARYRHFSFFAFTASPKLNKKLMNNTLGVKAADVFNLHP